MIDKSARQHYVIQGKVKNYLGKQKMVKAPKKWKSAPNHPETELAYITKAEKDALIKMNLHGSMNGKANKGPSGIISLNGGDPIGGYGPGGSWNGGGGHRGGGADRDPPPAPKPAPKPAPAPTRSRQESVAREEKAKVDAQKEQDKKMFQQRMDIANQFQLPMDYSATDLQARAKRAMTQPGMQIELAPYEKGIPEELQFWDGRPFTATPYDPYKVDTTPVGGDDKLPAGLGDVPGDEMFKPVEKYAPPIRHHGIDTGEEAYEMVGGVKVPLSMRGVKGVDPREDPERYFEKPGRDPFEVPEGERTIEEKREIEDWEGAQDWNLIKEMSDKGYNFEEIKKAVDKGLTLEAPTTDTRRQNLIDFGLRSIIPETSLEKSLLNRMKSFVPGAKTGISSLTDRMGSLGQYFNPGKMLTSFALNKMGLGFLNPLMGLASLFGFNPFKNLGTKWSGIPYKKEPIPTERGGSEKPQNVMQASIKKFQPTDQQTAQMNEIMRKRMILQGYADKGALNERGMNTLAQMNQLINQYQVSPESIWT